MSTASKREIIRNYIRKDLAKTSEHLEITDQENIIMNGIIDSLGLIKMIVFLEERLSLRLNEEDINPVNFESIDSISILVDRMLNSPAGRS